MDHTARDVALDVAFDRARRAKSPRGCVAASTTTGYGRRRFIAAAPDRCNGAARSQKYVGWSATRRPVPRPFDFATRPPLGLCRNRGGEAPGGAALARDSSTLDAAASAGHVSYTVDPTRRIGNHKSGDDRTTGRDRADPRSAHLRCDVGRCRTTSTGRRRTGDHRPSAGAATGTSARRKRVAVAAGDGGPVRRFGSATVGRHAATAGFPGNDRAAHSPADGLT